MSGLLRDRPGIAWPVTAAADVNSDANVRYPAPVSEPITHYVSNGPMRSVSQRSFEYSDPKNAAIVSRHSRRTGLVYNWLHGGQRQAPPIVPMPVRSSDFQTTEVSLHPWVINRAWYIVYPAATISQGTDRNLGIAERTPQLETRVSGGPGVTGQRMGPRPAFSRVQNVPRYSTAPKMYDTKGQTT